MAVVAVTIVIVFTCTALPLMAAFGLTGLAIALGCQTVVHLGLRTYFLMRIFHGFNMIWHALRAVAPTLPAVAAVVLARVVVEGPARTGSVAAAGVGALRRGDDLRDAVRVPAAARGRR